MPRSSFEKCGAFLDLLQSERLKLGLQDGEECFYRGVNEDSWSLEASLIRHCNANKITKPRDIQKLEADLFYEFKRRARGFEIQDSTGWDILFTMRHHLCATRILDWTEVPAIALFFATYKIRSGMSPCIWLLNPFSLNEYFDKDHDLCAAEFLVNKDETYETFLVDPYPPIRWKKPVALYPNQRDARLFAQQGYFTIQGSDARPIDKQVPHLVTKISVPADVVAGASDFLNAVGINEYSMFPDLDHLASFLNVKNRIG